MVSLTNSWGFPGGASGQCRRHKRCGFDPWAGNIPWRRAWHPLQWVVLLAWRVPRTEESGRLQFIGPHRVRHDGSDEDTCRHMPILETVGHGHNFPCKFFKIYLCTQWGQTLIAIGQHMAVYLILKRKISIQESKEWIYRNNQNIITINKRQCLFITNCF